MMNSANKVFLVFELLEAILVDIPLYDLILATTISQTFQETVSSSRILRPRLREEHIPLFATLYPGEAETEDICNVGKETPWLFRTQVDTGIVLVLRTRDYDIQLHVPFDQTEPLRILDSRQTMLMHLLCPTENIVS